MKSVPNIKSLTITLENEIFLNGYTETISYENGFNYHRKSGNFYFSCLGSIFAGFVEGKENFVFPTPESYEADYKFMDIRFKLEVLSLIWKDTKADNMKDFEDDLLIQKIIKYLETKFIYDFQLTKGITDVSKEFIEVSQNHQPSKTGKCESLCNLSKEKERDENNNEGKVIIDDYFKYLSAKKNVSDIQSIIDTTSLMCLSEGFQEPPQRTTPSIEHESLGFTPPTPLKYSRLTIGRSVCLYTASRF